MYLIVQMMEEVEPIKFISDSIALFLFIEKTIFWDGKEKVCHVCVTKKRSRNAHIFPPPEKSKMIKWD